jgi:hypothetical protein
MARIGHVLFQAKRPHLPHPVGHQHLAANLGKVGGSRKSLAAKPLTAPVQVDPLACGCGSDQAQHATIRQSDEARILSQAARYSKA